MSTKNYSQLALDCIYDAFLDFPKSNPDRSLSFNSSGEFLIKDRGHIEFRGKLQDMINSLDLSIDSLKSALTGNGDQWDLEHLAMIYACRNLRDEAISSLKDWRTQQ